MHSLNNSLLGPKELESFTVLSGGCQQDITLNMEDNRSYFSKSQEKFLEVANLKMEYQKQALLKDSAL